jgi:hypothetical protein
VTFRKEAANFRADDGSGEMDGLQGDRAARKARLPHASTRFAKLLYSSSRIPE